MLSQMHQQAMLDRLHSDVGRFVPQPPMQQEFARPQPEQPEQPPPPMVAGDRDLSPPTRTKEDDKAYKQATSKAQKEHDRRVQEKNRIRKQKYEKTIQDSVTKKQK